MTEEQLNEFFDPGQIELIKNIRDDSALHLVAKDFSLFLIIKSIDKDCVDFIRIQ